MPASQEPTLPEVYSAREIAQAAAVRPRDVRGLAAAEGIRPLPGGFYIVHDAVRLVGALSGAGPHERGLFARRPAVRQRRALPLAAAGVFHGGLVALIALMTSMAAARPSQVATRPSTETRLVFLTTPGPGGGGGGGGRHEVVPPPAAQRRGESTLRSPLPMRKPPPPIEPPRIVRAVDPPPIKVEQLPPIVAPVVPVAADTRDRAGLPAEVPRQAESHGSGDGGGAGTGSGTGLGEGTGPGIGPGSGGGTGGGPYRPGSGVTPPSILREVKPDYTEEGRRQGVEGDVVLEIVVRSDGSVGDVKLLQGLGAGLDQRAIDAVRQWRFSPAHRLGAAVDVVVEVAVEFKLR